MTGGGVRGVARLALLLTIVVSLVATIVAVALAGAGDAHRSRTSRMHNMRAIAQGYWGDITDTCDHDEQTMPIIRTRLPTWRAPDGEIVTRNAEFVHALDDGDDPPFHDCRILVQDRSWQTEELCRVIVHEFGHAAGWRAPSGQAFVWPDGTVDAWHSNDPTSLMWPFELLDFAPCANGAADT